MFKKLKLCPAILFPEEYYIHDLTTPFGQKELDKHVYAIGKYNEKREDMYTSDLFVGDCDKNRRNIHMGIDFFAPVGTPVYAFALGKIHLFSNNAGYQDYGYTIVTEHSIGSEGNPNLGLGSTVLYALYGHLSKNSIVGKTTGQIIEAGEIIGHLGDKNENGGWQPHLHFQLSLEKPEVADMPGVISEKNRAAALLKYPDPRIILGPVYL